MWFKRQKEPTKALRELQDSMKDLERRMDGLELDWTETYGKIRTTMGRITKSAAIIEARQPQDNGAPAAAAAEAPMSQERAFALAQIAKRRGMG